MGVLIFDGVVIVEGKGLF